MVVLNQVPNKVLLLLLVRGFVVFLFSVPCPPLPLVARGCIEVLSCIKWTVWWGWMVVTPTPPPPWSKYGTFCHLGNFLHVLHQSELLFSIVHCQVIEIQYNCMRLTLYPAIPIQSHSNSTNDYINWLHFSVYNHVIYEWKPIFFFFLYDFIAFVSFSWLITTGLTSSTRLNRSVGMGILDFLLVLGGALICPH